MYRRAGKEAGGIPEAAEKNWKNGKDYRVRRGGRRRGVLRHLLRAGPYQQYLFSPHPYQRCGRQRQEPGRRHHCHAAVPGSQTIDLTLEGESQPFTTVLMSDLLDQQPVDSDGVIAVYDRQHSGLFSGGWQYMRHLFSTSNEVLPYQWDENGLSSCISEIQQQVYQAPEDTTAQLTDGHLEVTTARDGRQISSDAVRELLCSAADASGQASYSMTLQPEVLPAKTLTAREIHDQLHGEMKNASYDAATGTIVPEQPGADFDVDTVQSALDSAEPGQTLTLDAAIEEPEVTASQLKAVLFRDVLGETRTHVSGSAGRIGNVKRSAKTISGVVLNSGETFSYNQTVGQRTEARGYKPAPAYVKGETVDEVGGGICQTSSTLYLACLLSNLEITERYAHRYVPAYISPGMDATVSWGGRTISSPTTPSTPSKLSPATAAATSPLRSWAPRRTAPM